MWGIGYYPISAVSVCPFPGWFAGGLQPGRGGLEKGNIPSRSLGVVLSWGKAGGGGADFVGAGPER